MQVLDSDRNLKQLFWYITYDNFFIYVHLIVQQYISGEKNVRILK